MCPHTRLDASTPIDPLVVPERVVAPEAQVRQVKAKGEAASGLGGLCTLAALVEVVADYAPLFCQAPELFEVEEADDPLAGLRIFEAEGERQLPCKGCDPCGLQGEVGAQPYLFHLGRRELVFRKTVGVLSAPERPGTRWLVPGGRERGARGAQEDSVILPGAEPALDFKPGGVIGEVPESMWQVLVDDVNVVAIPATLGEE